MYGLEGAVNVQGEEVKKLDIVANNNFINAIKASRSTCVMVSEENDDPILVQEDLAGQYTVVFDPLDGSSNIDCNISVGSIFGIYPKKSADGVAGSIEDVLRPGNDLVAAGYCMYGSSTQMVLTTGNGVNVFTLDPSLGEFILTMPNVRIPETPKTIYSVNEGNAKYWHAPTTAFVEKVKNLEKPYSLRYVGSMVSDVHRTLLYGGVFLYPADTKSLKGKLRLLYEGNPMSMIMEQAGGMSTTGTGRVMDIVPTSIHERTPIYCGCSRDVEMIIAEFAQSEPDAKRAKA